MPSLNALRNTFQLLLKKLEFLKSFDFLTPAIISSAFRFSFSAIFKKASRCFSSVRSDFNSLICDSSNSIPITDKTSAGFFLYFLVNSSTLIPFLTAVFSTSVEYP